MKRARQRRVVITGIGAITPIGHGRNGLWQGVLRGKSAVRRVSAFDVDAYRCQVAAEVRDFDPTPYLDRKQLKRLDRYSQFAVCAAKMAVGDAGAALEAEPHEAVGVSIGSALGGMITAEEQHGQFARRGLNGVSPMLAVTVFGAAASCNIAIEFGITGPNTANCNSCAAGAIAIGEAMRYIQRGEAEVMLAGGVEAPIAPLSFGAFSVIRAMSKRNHDPERASRPFDKGRDGFVMGEGAAILMLEEMAHAIRRGAHIYGEVLGYSLTNDAYHMSAPAPEGEGAQRAMRMCLADGNIDPKDVGYINAHGTSTPLGDIAETQAVKAVFGEQAKKLIFGSTKSMTGHLLGGAGALEAVVSLLAVTRGEIPPTINQFTPDPECDLDSAPNKMVKREVKVALSNAFGFGGHNATLAVRKFA